MTDALSLLLHLLTTMAKLIRPGGYRALIAENLLLKQQLIIHSRSRKRSPNLATQERILLGFLSLFIKPSCIARAAIILQPSTLFLFQYRQWKANLRVLEIEEIKSVPYTPTSHPFVERLIGSIRRELLD